MEVVTMGDSKLYLHCGANLCELSELDQYGVPDTIGKRSVHIPHAEMVNMTIGALVGEGYTIKDQAHSITGNGDKYFGLLEVHKQNMLNDDWGTIVGLRNGYSGISAAYVMGQKVFNCDNLSFHGDVQFSTRHDRNMYNFDLMVKAAANKLEYVHADMEKRTALYKERELTQLQADHLMIEGLRRGVYNPARIELVRAEWDTPSCGTDFGPTAWRYHNAVTQALKPRNVNEQGALPRIANQSTRLHAMLDEYVLEAA